MTQSREETPPSRIELVVLACLSQSKPPSDAELGDAIHQLALPGESAEAARHRAGELLGGLVARQWVTGDGEPAARGKRKSQPPRTLTETGKRALRSAFNLSRAPTWAAVRDKHLPSLALGVPPGSELADNACSEDALMAAVLGTRFGVRDAHTPMAVCDALIASALGMPAGKLTLGRMRAHVLARGIDRQARDAPSPGSKGYVARLAAWIACSTVGAGGTKRKMARALARRWVCGQPNLLGVSVAGNAADAPVTSVAGVQPPVPPGGGREGSAPPDGPGTSPPPQQLLEVVRETIPRIGTEGRFGEKVYVSAIWRTIERDRKVGDLSLANFKRWLVSANRDGWLVLARADLIGAMDARQVTESEINDRGATFHFVLDQRNGASVSQQETHAG